MRTLYVCGAFAAQVRRAEVGAGVDHRDRDPGGRLGDGRGNLIRVHGRVLPLVGQAGLRREECGLGPRDAHRRSLDADDAGLGADEPGVALDVPLREQRGDAERADPADDPRRDAASSAAASACSLSYETTAVPLGQAAEAPGSRAPRAEPTSTRPASTAKQNRLTNRIQISLI